MATHALALALPAVLFAAAYASTDRHMDPETLAAQGLALELHELASVGDAPRTIRRVHPDLEHISAWISSVGASVALFDHDGDDVANDVCLVDSRFDTVTVAPAPTTGLRFARFEVIWSDAGATPGTVAPMGCLAADMDEDGRQDLILYYWGRAPSLYLAADGFAERDLLPRHEIWNTNAAIVADVDGDGHLDLMFGNYFPGDAEILGAAGRPHMQRSMSRARNGGENRLLLGRPILGGGVAFEDASPALHSVARHGWTLALGAADLDGDALPEIYVANDFGPDDLLHNRSAPGEPAFARVEGRRGLFDPRSRVLGRDSFKGMGVAFGDINRDGRLDIHVSNIAEEYALMESHFVFLHTGDDAAFARGQAPFRDASGTLGLARSAWGWDARFVDLNNNGHTEVLQATGFVKGDTDRWPELHELAMGNDGLLEHPGAWPAFGPGADLSGDRADALFARNADGDFVDVAAAAGLGAPSVSRGIAVADVDRDGRVDAAIARQWEASVLAHNVSGSAGSALSLDLRLAGLNGGDRPAVGALATLELDNGARIAAVVPGGEGHSGRSAPELYFGLGHEAPATVRVQVRWRDAAGLRSREFRLAPGHHRILLEAETAVLAPDPGEIANEGH